MKGVILAGGMATRLRPLTFVTNKHLLPVYNKPMIYYPIEAMVKAGIKEILITSSPDHAGHFASLLGAGEDFGVRFYFAVQKNPKGGIADAIMLAEEFAQNQKLMVILGDNIFNFNLKKSVEELEKKDKGARIFAIKIPTEARHYGVVELDKTGQVISIEEKPEYPKSDLAQTGIYIYDERVCQFIRNLKPSARGELEVTDLNNFYLKEGNLSCEIVDWWIDAGSSHDELLRANNLVAKKIQNGEL